MWTRAELKTNAKSGLRRYYWQAFLVCIIAALLGAGTGGGNFNARRDNDDRSYGNSAQIADFSVGTPAVSFSYADGDAGDSWGSLRIKSPLYSASIPVSRAVIDSMWTLMTVITVVVLLFMLAFGILVSNVIKVGKCSYFMKQTAGVMETGVGELFSAFTRRYGNTVAVMFMRDIQIFLWTLLLIIPGIIKNYEYYMVPYLLAENPDMTWQDARDLSSRMMDGNKFSVWVLELSFLGWDLLGSLLCGVGRAFVAPYKEATYAELYHTLRNDTMRNIYGTGGNGTADYGRSQESYYEV